MKILILSSWRKRCGIAVYSKKLRDSLRLLGNTVDVVDFDDPRPDLSKYDIVHIQHEPLLINNDDVAGIARRNPHTIITCHRAEPGKFGAYGQVKKIIFLRNFGLQGSDDAPPEKKIVMPMGCPVYKKKNRAELRKQYGFKEESLIATTFGFLVGWKNLEHVLNTLASLISGNPNVVLQFLCSYHFKFQTESEAVAETLKGFARINNIEDRFILKTEWLSDEELLDRIRLSTIGFIHAPMHTYSGSAAVEQFVSARTPVVISESSHFLNLQSGCWRGSMDVVEYAPVVVEALNSSDEILYQKEQELDERYSETNWDVVGKMHEDLYKKVIGG